MREYIAHYAEHRHDPPVRDRRRRGQARPDRRAGDAGLHQPRAALGDRVQVPAGGGHHQAARHPGECRPDRPGHAVRGDDARSRSAARRSSGPPCTTSGRGRAQGRADRRHGRAAQGRRRDPRGGRAGAGPARRDGARVRVPAGVPELRHDAGPRGDRGRLALPEHQVLPCPAARAAVPHGEPGCLRHRGARLRGRVRAARRRAGDRRGRRVRARPPTSSRSARSS